MDHYKVGNNRELRKSAVNEVEKGPEMEHKKSKSKAKKK